MTRADAEARARELHDMVLPVAHHASMDGHTRCAKCDKIAAALLAAVAKEREASIEFLNAFCGGVMRKDEDHNCCDCVAMYAIAFIRARGEK